MFWGFFVVGPLGRNGEHYVLALKDKKSTQSSNLLQ